jgi:hypothetical protein
MAHWIPAHLHDSTADRYFGEPQVIQRRNRANKKIDYKCPLDHDVEQQKTVVQISC